MTIAYPPYEITDALNTVIPTTDGHYSQRDERSEQFWLKENGRPFQKRDLFKILDSYLDDPDPTSLSISIPCQFHDMASSGRIRWEMERGYPRFAYSCSVCNREAGDLHARMEDWLRSGAPRYSDPLVHINPYHFDKQATEPLYLNDTLGRPMLYKGLIHLLYGKPGTLKSWIMQSMIGKHDVRYLDYENGFSILAERLEDLKVDPKAATVFIDPQTPDEVKRLFSQYRLKTPEVLCIDGMAGLCAALGLDPDSNRDIQYLYNEYLYPLKKLGVCILVLDHLRKDGDHDDYPIGAQVKKGGADVAYLIRPTKNSNTVELWVTKDRQHKIIKRCEGSEVVKKYGQVTLREDGHGIQVDISPVQVASLGSAQISASDAQMLEVIYTFIEKNPGSTKSQIDREIPGKTERLRRSLKTLLESGYIEQKSVGTAHTLKVSKPLDLSWETFNSEL